MVGTRVGRRPTAVQVISAVLAAVIMINAGALVGAVAGAQGTTAGAALGSIGAELLLAAELPDDPISDIRLTKVDNPELPVPHGPPDDPFADTPELILANLEIPAIGVSQPMGEGVTLTAINRGPGHWPGTALPGQFGNVVVAGHRTTYTRPFWDLDLLQPGDELIFTTAFARYIYALDHVEIVPSDGLHVIDQTPGYTATLFGCHPKGSARQRIVAKFELIERIEPESVGSGRPPS